MRNFGVQLRFYRFLPQHLIDRRFVELCECAQLFKPDAALPLFNRNQRRAREFDGACRVRLRKPSLIPRDTHPFADFDRRHAFECAGHGVRPIQLAMNDLGPSESMKFFHSVSC